VRFGVTGARWLYDRARRAQCDPRGSNATAYSSSPLFLQSSRWPWQQLRGSQPRRMAESRQARSPAADRSRCCSFHMGTQRGKYPASQRCPFPHVAVYRTFAGTYIQERFLCLGSGDEGAQRRCQSKLRWTRLAHGGFVSRSSYRLTSSKSSRSSPREDRHSHTRAHTAERQRFQRREVSHRRAGIGLGERGLALRSSG
jgi:hypothetical protein